MPFLSVFPQCTLIKLGCAAVALVSEPRIGDRHGDLRLLYIPQNGMSPSSRVVGTTGTSTGTVGAENAHGISPQSHSSSGWCCPVTWWIGHSCHVSTSERAYPPPRHGQCDSSASAQQPVRIIS